MNVCAFVGNAVRDPDLRYTQSGKAVANLTIAVNRPFKNQKGEYEADFIDLVFWNKPAEIIAKYVNKGSALEVSGRLRTEIYEAADGSKRKGVKVHVNEFRFVGPRKNGNGHAEDDSSYEEPTSGAPEIDPADVPF